MILTKIEIENILGIKEYEFKPGQLTEISGKNGSGKTSILEAIKGALKGGHDATLLRSGEKQGRIVLVFSNGMQVQKTITAKKSDINLFDDSGFKQIQPQTILNELFDIMSVNPVAWITAKKQERTKAFLEAIPVALPTDKLVDCIKDLAVEIDLNITGHPLEIIGKVHEQVYEERTGINRAKKEKDGSISQLEESLIEIDFSAEGLEARINELDSKKEDWLNKKNEYILKIEEGKNTLISQANEVYEAELKAIQLTKQNTIDRANKTADEQKTKLIAEFEPKYNQLSEELTKLKEQQKNIGAVLKQKELIKQFQDESESLEKQSKTLTESLKKIESLKDTLFTKIPIEGLTIKDGELFRNEIPFDRLNTAQQIEIAIEVAKLRAGELKIVCVDGLEKFDNETFEIFKEQALKSGLQFIITKVDNEEVLRVTAN